MPYAVPISAPGSGSGGISIPYTGELKATAGYIHKQDFGTPQLDTPVTGIHAAVTLPSSGTTVITTAITNPDFPRVLVIGGNAAGIACDVGIVGTDIKNQALTETLTANNDTITVGQKAFKTVTQLTFGARTNPGDTVNIGLGTHLGLDRLLNSTDSVLYMMRTGLGQSPNSVTLASFTQDGTIISLNTVDATSGAIAIDGITALHAVMITSDVS